MRWLVVIIFAIVFAIIFVAGMAVGYYIALSLMNKIALLALGAFGFAFLTWVGSDADILCLLREWYKDQLEQREKRRTELIEHYKRINENVLKVWSNAVPGLELTAETLPSSFMPLYTNVMSIIKSPGRYDEAKRHLSDSYGSTNKVLNDLEKLEDNHNQQVASLITTLHTDFIDSIHNKNKRRPCNIDAVIHKYHVFTESDPPWYNTESIYKHFRQEAQGNHIQLTVVPLADQNYVFRRRTPTEDIDLGLGTEEDMNCLMQIVISFQARIIPQLRKLITSGNQINMKFNETLKQELAPITLDIEDGYLGGVMSSISNMKLKCYCH
jgi:hypothetical protein